MVDMGTNIGIRKGYDYVVCRQTSVAGVKDLPLFLGGTHAE